MTTTRRARLTDEGVIPKCSAVALMLAPLFSRHRTTCRSLITFPAPGFAFGLSPVDASHLDIYTRKLDHSGNEPPPLGYPPAWLTRRNLRLSLATPR